MTFIKSATRHLITASGVLATIVLVGCISANPLPDRNQTARLADGRTGSDLPIQDAWALDFSQASEAWDGIAPLTMDTAITVTLQNDPDLRLELTRVAQARADLAQSSLPPNPVIGVAIGAPIDGGGGAPAMVELMQQLTWLWTMDDRIDLQDERLASAILSAAQRTVDRASEVRTAFARALAARDLIEIETAYIETTCGNLRTGQGTRRSRRTSHGRRRPCLDRSPKRGSRQDRCPARTAKPKVRTAPPDGLGGSKHRLDAFRRAGRWTGRGCSEMKTTPSIER